MRPAAGTSARAEPPPETSTSTRSRRPASPARLEEAAPGRAGCRRRAGDGRRRWLRGARRARPTGRPPGSGDLAPFEHLQGGPGHGRGRLAEGEDEDPALGHGHPGVAHLQAGCGSGGGGGAPRRPGRRRPGPRPGRRGRRPAAPGRRRGRRGRRRRARGDCRRPPPGAGAAPGVSCRDAPDRATWTASPRPPSTATGAPWPASSPSWRRGARGPAGPWAWPTPAPAGPTASASPAPRGRGRAPSPTA